MIAAVICLKNGQYRNFALRLRAHAFDTGDDEYELYLRHFKKNPNKAEQYLDKASRKGHVESLFLCGELLEKRAVQYTDPELRDQAHTLVREKYAAAADRGHTKALRRLGNIYLHQWLGRGEEDDVISEDTAMMAYQFFKEGAERGDLECIFQLCYCLKRGIGCVPDPEATNRWNDELLRRTNRPQI